MFGVVILMRWKLPELSRTGENSNLKWRRDKVKILAESHFLCSLNPKHGIYSKWDHEYYGYVVNILGLGFPFETKTQPHKRSIGGLTPREVTSIPPPCHKSPHPSHSNIIIHLITLAKSL